MPLLETTERLELERETRERLERDRDEIWSYLDNLVMDKQTN